MPSTPQELSYATVGEQGYARQSLHIIASRTVDVLHANKKKTEKGSHVFAGCPQMPAHQSTLFQ